MRITINHFKKLDRVEADRLNGPNGGWDSESRFSRYADITMFAKIESVIEALVEWDEYDIVADMEVSGLEDAYMKSNHITTDWLKNDEVTFTEATSARSSSVGDIFSDPDTGKYWLVDNIGFKEITNEVVAAYAGKHKSAKDVSA
jgi:hypothetical protein